MGGAGQRPTELAQAVVVEVVPLALLGFLVELLVRRQVHQAHACQNIFSHAGRHIGREDADSVGNHQNALFAFFLQFLDCFVHVGFGNAGAHLLFP
ncbi:hypothetical protein D3C77_486400 [compost metagenome]